MQNLSFIVISKAVNHSYLSLIYNWPFKDSTKADLAGHYACFCQNETEAAHSGQNQIRKAY